MHFEVAVADCSQTVMRPAIVRFERDRTIQSLTSLFVSTRSEVSPYKVHDQKNVSWVQFTRSLQVVHGLRPATLPAVNQSGHFKNLWVVRRSAPGNAKFGAGAVVIEVAPIAVHSQSNVRLARVRFQAKGGIYCQLRQRQTAERMINLRVVKRVVRPSQPAICEKKSGIATDRLIKQVDRLEKSLLIICDPCLLDQRHSADVKVIGHKIVCRSLLYG